jgi:hypothetical protein
MPTSRVAPALPCTLASALALLASLGACASGERGGFTPSPGGGAPAGVEAGASPRDASTPPGEDSPSGEDTSVSESDAFSTAPPAEGDASPSTVADGGATTSALAAAGSAQYVVTRVGGFGMYCVDLDDAVFGTVGDVITIDFTAAGVTLTDTGASLPNCGFSCADLPVGTQMISNLGGSVDTQTGSYVSNDTYAFVDDQNPGGLSGSSQFYYSLTLTVTGNVLVITFKIPNPQGDVTCTLTKM